MGAANDFRFIDTTDEKEADRLFVREVLQALIDHGDRGYTGTIAESVNVTFTGKQFSDIDEAKKWIEDTAEKWGSTLAVRLTDGERDGYLFGGEYPD